MMIIYDTLFNANECIVLTGFFIGIGLVVFVPKRFTRQKTIVFFMCGVYSGFFFDHSLSVEPASYYDVNDTSNYEFMDFLSYSAYGTFSYFFFYFYDRMRLRPALIPVYVLVWSLLSLGIEWLSVLTGIFHYNLGYKLAYSFPIYLTVQTCWIAFYHRFKEGSTVPGRRLSRH